MTAKEKGRDLLKDPAPRLAYPPAKEAYEMDPAQVIALTDQLRSVARQLRHGKTLKARQELSSILCGLDDLLIEWDRAEDTAADDALKAALQAEFAASPAWVTA